MARGIKLLLLLVITLSVPSFVTAQTAKKPRILFVLDASSSMTEHWQPGKDRFAAAGEIIGSLMDSLSDADKGSEFALRVFGHQYPAQEQQCYDTKLEVPFSRQNKIQMQARLSALKGYGVSPITFSMEQAITEDFTDAQQYAYSMILVTDGGESCGGDLCSVVREQLSKKIFFYPYVISLVKDPAQQSLYSCMGTLVTASNEQEKVTAIHTVLSGHTEGFTRARTGVLLNVIPVEVPSKNIAANPDNTPNTKVATAPPVAAPVPQTTPLTIPENNTRKPQERPAQTAPDEGIFIHGGPYKSGTVIPASELPPHKIIGMPRRGR